MVYSKGGLNITIIVQDETWRKLGTWKYNDRDEKNKGKVVRTLKDAFGVDFKPRVDTDLDWMRGED